MREGELIRRKIGGRMYQWIGIINGEVLIYNTNNPDVKPEMIGIHDEYRIGGKLREGDTLLAYKTRRND